MLIWIILYIVGGLLTVLMGGILDPDGIDSFDGSLVAMFVFWPLCLIFILIFGTYLLGSFLGKKLGT